jgi:Ca-activated chloride channel homolog
MPSLLAARSIRKFSHWKTLASCGLAMLISAIFLPAQEDPGNNSGTTSAFDIQSPNIIRVSTNLVMVPVSVTDAASRTVQNLEKDDFRITENGKIETIAKMTEAGQSPLQLALLVDLSGSVHHRFNFELQAATHFLQKVWKSGDAVTLVAFGEKPVLLLRNSRSLAEVLRDILALQATESATALYDTVARSARLLRESATLDTRQAEIVLSDGEDNRSDGTLADAIKEVQYSDAIFYAINPGGNSIRLNEISLKGQQDLAFLANETGGTAFVADETSDLDEIFGRIALELRAQYLLSYYSSNPSLDGKFRRIVVSVPNRSDLRIRARQGYYAAKK